MRNVRSALVMISFRFSLPLRTVDAQLLCCVHFLLVLFSSAFPVLSLDEQLFIYQRQVEHRHLLASEHLCSLFVFTYSPLEHSPLELRVISAHDSSSTHR